MKNATNHTPYSLVTDRSQVVLSPYPADDQRVRLRRIGPDPVRHVTSDTTTHRAIEQDRGTLADRFVRNCTDILCTLNAEGRFINVSVASQLILGYQPEEMEGRLMSDFMSHEDFEKSMQAGREALSGQSFTNFENTCIAKDGSAVPMAWSVRWSAEDRLIYCVGRDDSEKKAVERELCELNESLEVKIRERTAQLEQSVKELEAFSYSVSHDLRAPLRIINGYARLLTDQYKKNADPEAREFLDAIIESTQYMGRLIDDLLNLSRIDRESVHKTEVNMDFLTRLIVSKMQEEAPSVTKDITIHELKPAICDQALIRQVWVNLLSNAVKYSRKKANPKIEVGSYDTDTSVVYYVKDNGAGFDMKFAAKLFGVFVRLHNRNEFEGTGVGLALVHRIIMKHGGKVWVNGKVDEGAVFYFSLPKP